jgi:hypothetical protein
MTLYRCGRASSRPNTDVENRRPRFGHEFAEHFGRGCPRPRDLPVPKILDFDEETGVFLYDERCRLKQPDRTCADEAEGSL